ncbi:hypothetical protein SAMN02744040_02350 [Tepidibacter thalassicus DSM 15285]|uniref:Uncharacterized protein n=1 Tax=Tepidibacter thalassicus DSM 15285 TaxID=1123350 RepID=A0A1M5TZT2_9FIRM|nr:hypothetical protein SAMN02744040_02350 [Tepidibacter thalassicus DSM 15285]
MLSKTYKKNSIIRTLTFIFILIIIGFFFNAHFSMVNLFFYIILSTYLLFLNYHALKLKKKLDILKNSKILRKIIWSDSHIYACVVSSISFIQTSNTNTFYKFILFIISSTILTIVMYHIFLSTKKILVSQFENKKRLK